MASRSARLSAERAPAGALARLEGSRYTGSENALRLERSRFGRGLLGRFFRFDRQLGVQPFDDAALERNSLEALSNELGRNPRARQLVRIGVVDDDFAV